MFHSRASRGLRIKVQGGETESVSGKCLSNQETEVSRRCCEAEALWPICTLKKYKAVSLCQPH